MMEASRQWASRPPDQRFENLDTLKASVLARAKASMEYTVDARSLQVSIWDPRAMSETEAVIPEETSLLIGSKESGNTIPSHWAFGQVASRAGAPASFLRKLSPQIAADCLNYCIKKSVGEDEKAAKLLVLDPDDSDTSDNGVVIPTLRAATSPSYGRIWDIQAVELVEAINERTGGVFFNPKEWGGRPAGFYASDHDVFMFEVDGGSMVDGGSERDQLHRGFFVWNSETGAQTFGIRTFLFRQVCGNHIIWDPEQVKELRIRHTSGAPDRFVTEAAPRLMAYVEQSTEAYQRAILAAKSFNTPRDTDDAVKFLKEKGFTNAESRRAIAAADREEGAHDSLWLLVQGLTSSARDMAYMDARIDLETRAGKLLELAA
jgi:hypothetical protein